MRRAIGLALCGATLVCGETAAAWADAPVLQVEILEDASRRLELEDVRRLGGAFRALPGPRPNLGYSQAAVWLRVTAPDLPEGRWLLELATPFLDRVEAYFVAPAGAAKPDVAGDMPPFAQRSYPHYNLVFPLPPGRGEFEAYLRVTSEGSLILPLALWREAELLRRDGRALLALGLYFGLLAALVAYNAFVFLSVRDVSYFWYVAYLGSFAGLQLTLAGLAQQTFWPDALGLSNPAVVLLLTTAEAAGLLFVRAFLRGAALGRAFDGAFLALAAAAVLAGAAHAFAGYSAAIRALILLSLAQAPLIAAAGALAWRRGFRPARFLLLAFAALAPGGGVYALRALGVLGSNVLTDHAIEFGTAAEAILLSFALADRINALNAAHKRAETLARRLREQLPARLIEAQEAERRRIAGELHDSIGQHLLAIRSRLRPGADGAAAAEAADLAGEAVNEVRAIAHGLHPHQIERLGLAAALESLLDEAFGSSRIACARRIELAEDEVAPQARIHVYRIAQEAIANVLRHAGATACSVELARDGEDVVLRVADDGRGLPHGADGFGLAGLRERARLAGGVLALGPAPGRGAALELRLPARRAA